MALLARPRPADLLDGMVDYLVDTPDGSVGIVDGWERDEQGRPQAVIVAQGWFGRRRFEVPLERLIEVDHEERRIILARGAAPLEPEGPLQRLVELGQSRSAAEAAAAFPRRNRQRIAWDAARGKRLTARDRSRPVSRRRRPAGSDAS